MITVVNITELEKLYRNGNLKKSDNFEFLNSQAQTFLSGVYSEDGEAMAEIIYLASLNGEKIVDASQSILTDEESELLDHLPQLEEEQIVLLIDPDMEVTTFSDKTMNDFDEAGLVDEEEREHFASIIREGADIKHDPVIYAVGPELKIEYVKAVMYSPEVAERVEALKEANKERAVLFTETNLF